MVERLNPRVIEHLSQTARLAREAEELMQELSTAASQRWSNPAVRGPWNSTSPDCRAEPWL